PRKRGVLEKSPIVRCQGLQSLKPGSQLTVHSRFFPAAIALPRLLRLQPNHESRHGIWRRTGGSVRLPCHGPPLEQDNRAAWFIGLSAPAAGDAAIGAGALGIPR